MTKKPNSSGYTNFRTGETDYLDAPPDDWSDYIPQHPAAQNLYRMLVATGIKPIDAAEDVLLRCVP